MKDINGSFYDILYTFLMKKQLFFSLCQVLDTFMKIKERKNHYTFDHLEMIFKKQLDKFFDAPWEEMTG
jgi:hypothetical protein